MFHVYNQATNAFFAQHVTKCKIFHHSARREAQTTFLPPLCTLHQQKQWKNDSQQILSRIFRTHFRIPFSFVEM